MKSIIRRTAAIVAAAVTIAACGGESSESKSAVNGGQASGPDAALRNEIASLNTKIIGGGASFPDAFYQAVNTDFNKVAGKELVTYAKSGSADGRAQLRSGTLDFAGSDSLPKPEEAMPEDLLFFPTVAAPITIAYNLKGVSELSLSPATLARVFQTEITNWNDPQIAADNPGVDLPDQAINVVRRSDGSGTTKNFTSFLVSAAPEQWRLGSGDEVSWPRGTQGAEKNSGVAEVIKKTAGAVGYIDLGDAAKAELKVASVQNSSGDFVKPTADAVAAAVEKAEIADDLTFNPLNSDAAGAYPITAPTWILVSATQDRAKAESLKVYLRYLLGPAQDQALSLGYAPLPDSLAAKALAQIDRIS